MNSAHDCCEQKTMTLKVIHRAHSCQIHEKVNSKTINKRTKLSLDDVLKIRVYGYIELNNMYITNCLCIVSIDVAAVVQLYVETR